MRLETSKSQEGDKQYQSDFTRSNNLEVNNIGSFSLFNCRIFTAELIIEQNKIPFEVDSGSDISAIPEEVYRKIKVFCK